MWLIISIIPDADYEGAVAKLEAGLSLYPDSDALRNKLSEFLDILSEQVKADTLSDAKALADAGEYESAIGQKTDAFTFSADITDAEYVKIVVVFSKYYVFDIFVDQLIISDVQLWP